MSTTIDQRVVEMRFDNKHFEQNVRTTMSTLDKLKQKLNLTGASKGLDGINKAAKNNNIHMLGAAAEQVGVKFSAMQVAGATAIARLTNQAMSAGEKIVKALTIDPITTGFNEYETKMGSIQTILANTQHAGTTLDDVTGALDELNTYADKTIYNFQEMTRNIGTFTAAGVDLNTSVQSIKGIANLAAVSGSTSQQASTAMYQLSQALAAGKVSLMDWNSVVNAGMGGKVFQDALIRTSELLKTGAKDAIKTYGSFRESLTQGEWLTTEVLTETLKQLSGAYTEADLIAQGFTQSQAKEIAQLAQTASDAATKVKTFTQLWDTLKESAQSGWAQTWEILIGDFEESKEFFTNLSDGIGGLIGGMSDWRNNMLGDALHSNYDKLISKINEAGIETQTFEEKLRKVFNNNKEFDKIIEKYGSLEKAIKKGAISGDILKKALAELGLSTSKVDSKFSGFIEGLKKIERLLGYGSIGDDVKNLQSALEALGFSVGECKIDGIIGPDTTKAIKEFQKEAGIAVDGIAGPETIAALEKAGKTLKDVTGESKKTVESYDELIDGITQKGGRELLLEGLANTVGGLVDLLKLAGRAFASIFPADNAATKIFNAAKGFNEFAKSLRLFTEVTDKAGNVIMKPTETGEKLLRTFKGVFAIVDILTTVLGGGFKIAFKVITQLLGAFDLNLLDVTANVGDAIVKFRDWLDSVLDFTDIFKAMVPYLKKAGKAISDFMSSVKDSDSIALLVKNVKNAGKAIFDWIKGFKEAENIPKYIFDGLVNGLKTILSNFDSFGNLITGKIDSIPSDLIAGLSNGIWNGISTVGKAIIQLGITLLEKLREVLGIHSPSTETYSDGMNLMLGLWEGIKAFSGMVFDGIKNVCLNIIDIIKEVDLGQVLAGLISVGFLSVANKFATGFAAITAPAQGLGDMLSAVGEMIEDCTKNFNKILKSFSKVLNSFALSIKAKALKDVAIAIGILVGAIVVLTLLDPGKVWNAVGVLGALAVGLGALFIAIDKLGSKGTAGDNLKDAINLSSISFFMIALSASLLIMAGVLKILETIDIKNAAQVIGGLVLLLGSFAAVFWAFGSLVKGKAAQNIGKAGGMMLKMSFALLLMVGVVKLISKLEWTEMAKGGAFIAGFTLFVLALTGISLLGGKKIDSLGGMMLKMSFALTLMIGVVKMASRLEWSEMGKAGVFVAGFTVFVAILGGISRYTKEVTKVGGTLLAISAAMLILVGVAKLIATMEWGEMGKAAVGIGFLTIIIDSLIKSVGKLGNNAPKIAGSILAIAGAIGILAGISVILSFMDIGALAKGLVAVGILSTMIGLLILATKDANDVKGNIIAMSVAIGIMAASLVVLSMIDGGKLAGAAIAMGVLMGIFALMIKATQNAQKCLGNLIVMTVAIGVIAGAIYLLSGVESSNMIGASIAISVLMGAMALLAKMSQNTASAIPSIITMGLVVAGLAYVLKTIGELPIISTIVAVNSLTKLLTTMSIVLKIMKHSTPVGASAIIAMVVMVGVMELLGLVLYHIGTLKIQNALVNTIALSTLLTSMAISMAILSKFGGNVIGIGALATLIIALGVVVAGIGDLATKFPQLEEFVNTGMPLLEKIGTAIGSFFGNMVGEFLGGLSAGLPEIGSNLTGFMDNVQGFVNGARNIDESAVTGVKNLAAMIIEIAKANIADSLSSIITGDNSMETFGTQIKQFGEAMVGFSQTISGNIDESAITAAASAGKMMAEMQSNIQGVGGLMEFFAGEKNLGQFGAQIKQFGEAIVGFSNTIVEGGGINETAVTAAASAGKVMSEMQASLPGTGGVLQWFLGEKDFNAFSTQLVAFGGAIVAFSNKVKGNINEEAVAAAANAGELMITMQKKIPSSGGVVQFFTGEHNFATFSTQLVAFGSAIVNFSKEVSEEGAINETAIEAAAKAGTLMAELNSKVVPSGGVIEFFSGKKNLGSFGTNIVKYGEAIVEFSKAVSADSGLNVDAIQNAVDAGAKLTEVQKAIPSDKWLDGKISIDSFGKKIKKYGEHMADFSDEVSDIDNSAVSKSVTAAKNLVSIAKSVATVDADKIGNFKKVKTIGETLKGYYDKIVDVNSGAITKSITNAKKLVSLVNSMAGLNASGINTFKNAMKSLGTVSVNDFVESFNKAMPKMSSVGGKMTDSLIKGMQSKRGMLTTTSKNMADIMIKTIASRNSQFNKAAVTLMNGFVKGIASGKSKIKSGLTSALSSGVSAARGYHTNFYNAGSYLCSGLASGISSNSYKAVNAARAMAKAVKNAAKEALKINSPSKVFVEIGSGVIEGFVKGIDDNMGYTTSAVTDMADTAKNGFGKAISSMTGLLDGSMEMQPTIRPVLDLSNVKSGAASIGGMLNNQSVGISSNISAISNMMNQRNQNGASDDIVSAINKLRGDLGKTGNTSYNLNGLTYNEGSDVAEAFKAIVRAATVGRRV